MFAIVFILVLSIFSALSDLEVSLPNGKIRGQELKTHSNKPFHAFTAIPYAAPPVGPLRFMPPDPKVSWNGVLDATKSGNMCYQYGRDYAEESEDCLHINVYTPVTNSSTSKTKLPVLFWIYGGAFIHGAANNDNNRFRYFMDEEVVVVSHNYRVGAFGFLSTGDMILPGNAGLKDQQLALKWTKENIGFFGGDPEKITIFGQSAGGASVGYHYLSKNSAGLFRAGIAQSGSPMNMYTYRASPRDYAYALANVTGYTGDPQNSSSILEHLQSIPADRVDKSASATRTAAPAIAIEPQHDGAFLTEAMYEVFDSGNFTQVPIIIGINSEEYLSKADNMAQLTSSAKTFDDRVHLMIPRSLHQGKVSIRQVGTEIKEIYVPNGQNFVDHLGRVVAYYSDNTYSRAVIKQAKLMSKFTDVYFYQFSYAGGLNQHHYLEGAEKCAHGDDSRYLFTNQPPNKYSEPDFLTHKRILSLWANFAKTLNPTPERTEIFENIEWPKVEQNQCQYLDIDKKLTIKQEPKGDVMSGWENIFEKYGQRPFITY